MSAGTRTGEVLGDLLALFSAAKTDNGLLPPEELGLRCQESPLVNAAPEGDEGDLVIGDVEDGNPDALVGDDGSGLTFSSSAAPDLPVKRFIDSVMLRFISVDLGESVSDTSVKFPTNDFGD